MKASSRDVVAPASVELTTPANRTPKPTTVIAAAATRALFDASVPMHTNTAPVAHSAACACRRSRSGPPKSTSSNSANDPNAAKNDVIALPMTS